MHEVVCRADSSAGSHQNLEFHLTNRNLFGHTIYVLKNLSSLDFWLEVYVPVRYVVAWRIVQGKLCRTGVSLLPIAVESLEAGVAHWVYFSSLCLEDIVAFHGSDLANHHIIIDECMKDLPSWSTHPADITRVT